MTAAAIRRRMVVATALSGGAAFLAGRAVRAQEAGHPADKPLVVGSDFGIAPWMVRGAAGPEGFGMDLATDLARRLRRPGVEVVDITFANLFPALFSGRIEFTVNPLNITAERAERMLYTQPFFATGNGFLVRAADSMSGFEALRGKALAVNRGTISDTWATENAGRYGFEIQRYETFPDSVQAVLTGRAFTALNEIPTTVYAASRNPRIKVGFQDLNGRNFGIAFRKDDAEYRNRVDDILTCMKRDGTLAGLYRKWYGSEPPANTAIVTVYEGYGPPGLPGHDPTPHAPACG